MGARREQSRHSNNFLRLPNNPLIYPAASCSVWCRGTGFFYTRIEGSGGETAVMTIGINELIITDVYI